MRVLEGPRPQEPMKNCWAAEDQGEIFFLRHTGWGNGNTIICTLSFTLATEARHEHRRLRGLWSGLWRGLHGWWWRGLLGWWRRWRLRSGAAILRSMAALAAQLACMQASRSRLPREAALWTALDLASKLLKPTKCGALWACKRSYFSSSKVLRQMTKQHAHEGACKSTASCSPKAKKCFPKGLGFLQSFHMLLEIVSRGGWGRFGPSSRTPQSPWNVKRAVSSFRNSFGLCSSASHGHCRTANCKIHGGAPVQCKKCCKINSSAAY